VPDPTRTSLPTIDEISLGTSGAGPSDLQAPPALARGSRLDPWVEAYSDRAGQLTTSAIRALFAVASRPEVVSLAGGMPDLSVLPLDLVGQTLGRLVAERGTTALQYGPGQADPVLREQILQVMRPLQVEADADRIVVTTGSQQALDLITRIFVDPGDVVVAEAPSYVGALGVFRSFQADVVHVPLDHDGLVPEELERTLTRLRADGRTVKFLYTVPNHHNPAGVTLSADRRPQVVDIARKHGVLVVEDDPYGLLGFDGPPLPALQSLDPAGVVHLGSFSKTFSPGVRVGWALAPRAVRDKLVLALESAILCPSSFSQMAVSAYLSEHDWAGQIDSFRSMYRRRRDATLQALAELVPQASWTCPAGGFYVWLTLPEGLDAQAMLPRAVTRRVAYVPGSGFYADDRGHRHLRISYCFPSPERIREGVRRLAGVIESEQEMLDTFSPGSGPSRSGGPGSGGR